MSCIVKFQKFLCSDLLGWSLERIMAWGASGREGMGLRACCQNKGLQHLNGRVAHLQTITWRQLRTWSLCSRCSRITEPPPHFKSAKEMPQILPPAPLSLVPTSVLHQGIEFVIPKSHPRPQLQEIWEAQFLSL